MVSRYSAVVCVSVFTLEVWSRPRRLISAAFTDSMSAFTSVVVNIADSSMLVSTSRKCWCSSGDLEAKMVSARSADSDQGSVDSDLIYLSAAPRGLR